MVDIASLAIQINTSDVSRAGQELDKLAGAGKKVEQAASGIAAATKADLGSAATTWKQFISERLSDYRRLEGGHAEAMRRIADEWKQHRESLRSGFTPAQLGDATRAFTDNSDAMRQAGLSAGQYQQAIRMLPMQLTDVVTSLASGMPLWMVAIQQGGQVRDAFGGIGNAARAVVGEIGPLNLAFGAAAATIGAAILAFEKGQSEMAAFNEALILTGNSAGMTSGQLADLAREMDKMAGVTTSSAAEALAKVAETGRFTGEQIGLVATTAEQMRDATGRSIDETVKEFLRLRADPVKAILDLNDQYHFLTESQLEQIKTLQDQGRQQDAVTASFRTFAGAIAERTPKILENMSWIERKLHDMSKFFRELGDDALNIGRVAGDAERLEQIAQRVAYLRSTLNAGPAYEVPGAQDEINRLLAEQEQINARIEAGKKTQGTVDSERYRAADEWERRTLRYADARKQLEKEISEIRTAGLKAGIAQPEIDKQIAAATKQFEERQAKASRPRAFTDDAATRMLQQLRNQEATLQAQLAGNDKLTAAQRAQVEWAQQLADLKNKSILTAEQKSLLASQDRITAQLAENAALEEQIQARDRLAEQAQWMATLQERVGNRQNAADIAVQGVGLGDRARQELEQVNAVQREYARSREELARQQGTVNGLPEDQFRARIDALRAAEEQEISILQEGAQRKREAEGDWMNGASRAWQNYLDEQTSIAAQSEQLFTSAFSGMEDALFGFVTTGKLSFQDLQKAFVGTALQMLIRWATAQVSMAALNAFTSMAATPIVGPFAAPAAAATAAASAATFAADIASVAGMAHDGIDSIPREGTWLLDKGERVVDSRTNQDLKQYLSGQQQGAGGMNVVVNNYSNSRVETRQNKNGELEVIIRAVEDRLVGGIAAGDSRLGTVMERSYGMQRQGR